MLDSLSHPHYPSAAGASEYVGCERPQNTLRRHTDNEDPIACGTITNTNSSNNGLNSGTKGKCSEEPEAVTALAATRPTAETPTANDDGSGTRKDTAAEVRTTYGCAGTPVGLQCKDAGAEAREGLGLELLRRDCGSGATASGWPRERCDREGHTADGCKDGGCSSSSSSSSSSRSSSVGGSRSHSDSGGDCRDDAEGAPAFEECWSVDGQGPPAEKLLRKLRWATLGPQFNWTQRQYDFVGVHRQLPSSLETLARQLAAVVENLQVAGLKVMPPAAASGGYKPDAAIINYYQQGDVLGGHLDDVERDMAQPIISVSLGCPAIFLMGGPTKEVSPSAILLRGGDVLVLAGEARCCYHGVPRILEALESCSRRTKDVRSHMAGSVDGYAQCARINISIRAVA
ncbi:hypothetical protein Vretimale_13395 [Volvox reticuliferus]|uniref:Fe2OG dioxygenase domain-containing protein n=1 Tax=Volvox reticuliferus TaxID=1737510 RepID=A0A8J4GMF2_9CHLO|nr:hypothetical protein Vretimale_13395 [Volvox reticuliferus]